MSSRRIAVVSAGVSVPSSTRLLADRLTTATVDALRERGDDTTVEVVELRDRARDLADFLITGFAGTSLRAAIEAVTGADGVIAVTPVFSASFSGLFKTFFDVLDTEALTGTPVLLGATAGTARHSLVIEHAMRPLFSYLHAIPVPTGVFAATEDWGGAGGVDGALAGRAVRAAGEFADLLAGRRPTVPADAFDDASDGPFGGTPSFEALLRGA